MPTITGFGYFEKHKVKDAIKDARKCLDRALEEAFGNNTNFQSRVGKYFSNGAGGTDATNHLIMKTINSMKLMIDSDSYVILRGGFEDGTNAEADHISQISHKFKGSAEKRARTVRFQGTCIYEGKLMNVIEGITSYASKIARPELLFYDDYFHLPYKKQNRQSQVETFLHELSHTAAGTVDVDAPNCYEYSGVQYCMKVGKAAQNAENYGMFLQSYLK